jgi:hypothetical protein
MFFDFAIYQKFKGGTLNEGVPLLSPSPVTGEGDGGRFFEPFNGFRGRGELFQTVQWFSGMGMSKINQWFVNVFKVNPSCPRFFFLAFFNPKRPGLLGGVVFGEMKFVLSNCLSSDNLSILYER